MIRLWFCKDCQELLTGKEALVTHHGHVVERMVLHRRERRGMAGVETQWSSDWVPE